MTDPVDIIAGRHKDCAAYCLVSIGHEGEALKCDAAALLAANAELRERLGRVERAAQNLILGLTEVDVAGVDAVVQAVQFKDLDALNAVLDGESAARAALEGEGA